MHAKSPVGAVEDVSGQQTHNVGRHANVRLDVEVAHPLRVAWKTNQRNQTINLMCSRDSNTAAYKTPAGKTIN